MRIFAYALLRDIIIEIYFTILNKHQLIIIDHKLYYDEFFY